MIVDPCALEVARPAFEIVAIEELETVHFTVLVRFWVLPSL